METALAAELGTKELGDALNCVINSRLGTVVLVMSALCPDQLFRAAQCIKELLRLAREGAVNRPGIGGGSHS
jgi:hypothetical protein